MALTALAMYVECSGNKAKPSAKLKWLSIFLDNHLLGIMAFFTDAIDTSKDRLSLSEKKRSLRAVEILITVAKTQISIALPQVSL